MTGQPLNVAVPWSLSHYIPLGGFHPLYRALFEHAPNNVALSAWDNVKLYRRFSCDISMRNTMLRKAEAEEYLSHRFNRGFVAKRYMEHFWPPEQVMTTELMGDIEFHHTAPFPSLKRPFVFHCESFSPVLFPFAQQGSGYVEDHTELREHYRGIFANPLCLGIFSHIPETLETFKLFFSDPVIDRKLFPSKIGLSQNAFHGFEQLEKPPLSRPRFLFINSSSQNSANFFCRGGHIVLRFWKEFLTRGRDGLLILRCTKPSDKELIEYGVDLALLNTEIGRSIIWAQDYLACHEINALMGNVHFFLLPSASLHSSSIMHAMVGGTIPVVSDVVGMSTYITDNENGIVLHGLERVIWQKDGPTKIQEDRYERPADLDDSFVAQLTSRVCTILEEPTRYWNMSERAHSHAQQQFSGQVFAQEFWSTVYDLYSRFRRTSATIPVDVDFEEHPLDECRIQSDAWSRVFESPTEPMLRINTGRGAVWELGGTMIHANENTCLDLKDWSVLAQPFNNGALKMLLANTLEELEGSYLCPSEARRKEVCRTFIGWISRILRPFPTFYRFSSSILSTLRHYGWTYFAKPKADPDIELVCQGVSGFNIIRYMNRYYPILQSEENFIPDKTEGGVNSSCFSASSVDKVLRYIATRNPSSIPFNLDNEDSGLAELILDKFHGFNIFRQGEEFHAILQNKCPLVHEKLFLKQYPRSFSGFSIEDVQSKILSALNTEEEQANSIDSVVGKEGPS